MMTQIENTDSNQIEAILCERLTSLRLDKNLSQTEIAERAGISRRTLSRLENGQGVSLNTFIRVMRALGLLDRLAKLIPDSTIRPIDRVQKKKEKKRKHASSPRKGKSPPEKWEWGDE